MPARWLLKTGGWGLLGLESTGQTHTGASTVLPMLGLEMPAGILPPVWLPAPRGALLGALGHSCAPAHRARGLRGTPNFQGARASSRGLKVCSKPAGTLGGVALDVISTWMVAIYIFPV
jgi:hypothetical protein